MYIVYINTYIFLMYILPLYGLRGDRSEATACMTQMY